MFTANYFEKYVDMKLNIEIIYQHWYLFTIFIHLCKTIFDAYEWNILIIIYIQNINVMKGKQQL